MKDGQMNDDDGLRLLDLLLAAPESEMESGKSDRAAPLSSLEKLIKQRAPSQEQLEQLTRQVEALTAEVERLTKLKLPRPPKPPASGK
jgi:hypothetical protein